MDFEKLYKECVRRITGLLRRNSISECPENYVNEAYMQLFDAGEEISLDSIYLKARELALTELNIKHNLSSISKQTTKVCPRCKTEYPVAYFRLVYDKNLGRKRLYGWCKKCKAENDKIYFRRIRGTEKFKQKAKVWNHNYWKKNKEKVKEKLRRHTKELYDCYIRRKLRDAGWKKEDITAEVIEQRRQQILYKRNHKNFPRQTVKVCPICKKELPVDSFGIYLWKNTPRILAYCKSCKIEYQREYRAKKKDQLKSKKSEAV